MTASALHERVRPHSVPVCIVALVAVAVVVLPPFLLGELTGKTYALTAAWVFLSLWASMPFALAVGIVTLPFVYTGTATYAAPTLLPEAGGSASATAVVRHFAAGFAYALAAGVVGAIGLGADFATANEPAVPTGSLPSFTLLGGSVVAACYVALQLWRHDATPRGVDRRAVAGTVALGAALAPAGRAAVWTFQHGLSF